MIPKIPKKYCNQSVVLRKLKGKDEWQNKEFENDVIIEHMIFQFETIYSSTNNSREVIANAIAYLFGGISTVMPSLVAGKHEGSELDYEGKTYTINKIVDNRNPFTNEVYSYELEVM